MIQALRDFLRVLYLMTFIDQKSGQPSHTKFWSNVGYAIMVYTFVHAVKYGSQADVMIWVLFGVVVIGNRTILKLFQLKNGTTKDTESE